MPFFFGMVGFYGAMLVPIHQVRTMYVAGDAQALAACLNQFALNLACK